MSNFLFKSYKALISFLLIFVPFSKLREFIRIYAYIKRDVMPISPFHALFSKNNKKYDNYLSVLACAKDEADYLQEWIEYYKLMGVEKFYIYDNESSDNTKEVLQKYIDSGLVDYTFWKGHKKGEQLHMYADGIKKIRGKTRWLAVVDIDEFIQPLNKNSVKDVLYDNNDKVQILSPWLIFGDSWNDTFDASVKYAGSKLVIERFNHRAENFDSLFKCIVNPDFVYALNPHSMRVFGKTELIYDIRTNHYFSKTKEEYINKKAKRGDVMDCNSYKYNLAYFDIYNSNNNKVFDDSMKKYADKIKKNLNLSGGRVIITDFIYLKTHHLFDGFCFILFLLFL